MKKIKFYLDFDGTISQNDVVDMVLDRFAKPEWRAVEEEWQAGKIGSRECLSRQMALVSASKEDLAKMCQEIKVDPGFISFLKKAKELGVPVKIVSDGFDFLIQQVLGRNLMDHPELLRELPIYSNKIEWTPEGPRAAFLSEDLCRHGCANCKPEVIKDTANADDMILFVGDGLSDRYAAAISNRTFAKGKLIKFCEEYQLDHEIYKDFGDVERWLVKHYDEIKAIYEVKLKLN